jgi:hypothetical protein
MSLLDQIAEKNRPLDQLRPLSAEALRKLRHYYDIEITQTSNAIEGNSLSPVQTTLAIEQRVPFPRHQLSGVRSAVNCCFPRFQS